MIRNIAESWSLLEKEKYAQKDLRFSHIPRSLKGEAGAGFFMFIDSTLPEFFVPEDESFQI